MLSGQRKHGCTGGREGSCRAHLDVSLLPKPRCHELGRLTQGDDIVRLVVLDDACLALNPLPCRERLEDEERLDSRPALSAGTHA